MMLEAKVRVRLATIADAAPLAELGERMFRETFGPHNRPEDMAAFLSTAYGEARQRAEIVHPQWITLVAECVESADLTPRLAGFAQLREGSPSPAVSGVDPIEIQRFYVDSAWHGQGVAQALMNATEAAAHERTARTLWLGVWEKNARAISFYEKCGFRHVGDQPFLLGGDLQTDWVMERALETR